MWFQGVGLRGCRINFGAGSFDWKLKALACFLRVKSDMRVTRPPSRPPFSKCIRLKFRDSHLFKIVERFCNNAFRVNTTSQSQGVGVASYALERIWFLWQGGSNKLRRRLLWLEIESSISLLSIKSDRGPIRTSLHPFPPNGSDQNSEIIATYLTLLL